MQGIPLLSSVSTVRVAQPNDDYVCYGDAVRSPPTGSWAVCVSQSKSDEYRVWFSFDAATELSRALASAAVEGSESFPSLPTTAAQFDWPYRRTHCAVCHEDVRRDHRALLLQQETPDGGVIASVWTHRGCIMQLSKALSLAWAYQRILHVHRNTVNL